MNEIELFSIEAEQSLIGGLLIDPSSFDRIADKVTADDFYADAHQRIYRHIAKLMVENRAVDLLTVLDSVEHSGEDDRVGGLAYLGEMANATPSAANAVRYAEIVHERAMLRRLLGVASEINEGAREFGMTANEKIDRAQGLIMALSDAKAQRFEPVHVGSVISAVVERMSDGGMAKPARATGFVDLDARMNGGLRGGDLIIVAARPGMGKSAIALQISAYFACEHGVPALFCSQEMPNEQLATRAIGVVGRVDLGALARNELTDDQWGNVTYAVGKLNSAPLYLDEQPSLRPLNVRNKARQVKRVAGGLGLLVVDYLQLMVGDDKTSSDNRNSEIEKISRGLKTLAKELDIPILALSQLNRELERRPNKRPVNSDLRDSGAIEQDADAILFIYRDEVYNPDSPDAGKAEVIVGKCRSGRQGGAVGLAYRGEYTRFENLDYDWKPTEPVQGGRSTRGFRND